MDPSRPPPIGFELHNDPSQDRWVRLKIGPTLKKKNKQNKKKQIGPTCLKVKMDMYDTISDSVNIFRVGTD